MATPDTSEGFIVHAWSRTRERRTVLYLAGRLADGRTFAVVERRHRPHFHLRASDLEAARRLPEAGAAEWRESGLRTMDGEPCLQALFATAEERQRAREALARAGVRTYEADLRVADQFRLERGIHGSLRLEGPSRPGRHVDLLFEDPRLSAAEWVPRLSALSLDIETDVAALPAAAPGGEREGGGEPADGPSTSLPILAIGLSHRDPFHGDADEVLYAGGRLPPGARGAGTPTDPLFRVFAGEREMLAAFARRVQELDPDVLTGWNVVDFDLRALSERFRAHRLRFDLGRTEEEAAWLPNNQGRASRAVVPGRQVWDGMRLVRAAPERYEDYSLQTVAESVLGSGKRIEAEAGQERVEAIARLHRESPEEFCRYCHQDARLVQDIFARTGLLELTLRRVQLIGMAPDLAWTSIPAFEHLYIEAMHERGVVAPTPGVDPLPLDGAPGGGILTPRPGAYERVLLFDFQSLYPSIMRSFNIDPLGFVPPGDPAEADDLIEAPNGARFRREPGILPELLNRFFDSRREARARGDEVATFVYKIIMNSFYGVLGASGCRFAGSDLAGAITSFGQHLLTWCRDYLEASGRQVLYGDTDSLFVQAPGQEGEAIAAEVNAALAGYIAGRWRVEPRFVLEYEKEYERFFLPPMRGVDAAAGQGRAKSYAGLVARPRPAGGAPAAAPAPAPAVPASPSAAPSPAPEPDEEFRARIEVTGMEAVRRDWTDLARSFQLRLLELLFRGSPVADFRAHIAGVVRELRAGGLDGSLVYRKALRKPVEGYTRNTPPHVKAAGLLAPGDRRGLIRYVLTVEGPQPAGRLTARIDYDHYVEKQLKPIAAGFTEVLGTSVEVLFGEERQLSLF